MCLGHSLVGWLLLGLRLVLSCGLIGFLWLRESRKYHVNSPLLVHLTYPFTLIMAAYPLEGLSCHKDGSLILSLGTCKGFVQTDFITIYKQEDT